MEQFRESILNLVVPTSSNLPPDIRRALERAIKTETPNTQSSAPVETNAINVDMAYDNSAPSCQDTGIPTFDIKTPIPKRERHEPSN